MKTAAAVVVALTILVNPLFAQDRPIDLPRRGPEPAVALARSIIIPGGGWFYLAQREGGKSEDWFIGALHVVATVGGALVAKNNAGGRNNLFMAAGLSVVGLSRAIDFWGVTEEAASRKDVK